MYNYAKWGPPQDKSNYTKPIVMTESGVIDPRGIMLSKNSLGNSLNPPILKFVKKNY